MNKFKEIRPVVLGLLRRGDKILVGVGHDEVKGTTFFRCLGGGIEFQEQSKDALVREFKEEINVDIEVGDYLGLTENIFTYNGKAGHELVMFYNVSILDKDYKETYHIVDDGVETDAIWVEVEKFKSGELMIYPEKVIEYL